jgi:glycosyltransferase involved in cell wall biosynthesis
LHATSEEEYEDIRRLGFRVPVAIIPNGVTMPAVVQRPSKDLRSFLYLGRLHPEKGLENLLHAWSQIESKLGGWCLRIVGPDPIGYRFELEALSRKLKLNKVFFDEAVVGELKSRVFNESEVLVLPSPSENFGMVVAEALAAEVPVIATNGTPWSDLSTRRAGWYCGTSAKDIADTLQLAAATHWCERRKMGKCGREWMRSSYGWDSVAGKMATTYRWLFEGGKAPSWVDGVKAND